MSEQGERIVSEQASNDTVHTQDRGERAASASHASAPAPDSEKRSRSATRRKLVTTAAEVFAEKGIDAASVNELCAAAGFTRGAFYSNFETKTDLAVAVLEESVDHLEEQLTHGLDTWLDSPNDAHEVITHIVTGVSGQTVGVNLQAVRIELFLAAFRSPEIRARVLPLKERLQGAVEEALTRTAQAQHREFTAPAAEVARMMLTSYSGQLTDQMATGEHTPLGEQAVTALWFAFTRERD